MRADGILVLDKPGGMTSRQAVALIAETVGERKAGHAGTLDPIATGVLPVCLGRGTLLSSYLSGGTKKYEVSAMFGVETDTYDLDGRIIRETPTPLPDEDEVVGALERLKESPVQKPPPFSAVKHKGRPLYYYARRGLEVEIPEKEVSIEGIRLLALEESGGRPVATIALECGPGTYVRSIVRDLGVMLGCGACVCALRRTSSGVFGIDDAHGIQRLLERGPEGIIESMISLEQATDWMPSVSVMFEAEEAVRAGKPLKDAALNTAETERIEGRTFRVLGRDGGLLALYGPPRGDDPKEVVGRAVRVIRPSNVVNRP